MSDDWISPETEPKERDFRGLASIHMRVCQSILTRYGGLPYLYVDLYAGPGHLQFNGRRFLGSPLIIPDIAEQLAMQHQAVCFEKIPETASRLRLAVADLNGRGHTIVHAESCEDGFPRWLDQVGRQPRRHGLVYSDPIRDEIPVALLNGAADHLPKVDLLSYVSATQYKRRRGVDPNRPLLSDHIAAVRKKYALIREPAGAWQWTFVLWSNWDHLPEWRKRGFYRVDSQAGARILAKLTLTSKEHHEAANTPLPFDEPYQSYAEYLRHPRFLLIRAEVFTRAGGSCERCHSRPPTEPHHLRYPPWGTFDVPENMIAICHRCHCEIHGKER